MKILSVTGLAALVVLAMGCSATNVSSVPSSINAEIDTDLKAQVTVGPQISGKSSMNIIMNMFALGESKFADGVVYGSGGVSAPGLPDPVAKTKAAAAYNAVSTSGADVILAPRYVVEVMDYIVFKKVTVTVTGYSGKINGIR
jgi:hypothetical protein